MLYTFPMLEGEYWWGGSADDGTLMPFSAETSGFSRDFRVRAHNQTMPLYLSSRGRYIWSEQPFGIKMDGGVIEIDGEGVTLTAAGETLRDAYLAASHAHFPFTGEVPPEEFFRTAQYNTWMEFTYDPTEEGVLAYAHAIVDNGFKPGILIIDEGWHRPYGDWRFDTAKFPHPKEMMDELHALGFKVMLWVVPYVTASGLAFITPIRRDLSPDTYEQAFMRDENGRVLLMEWWNGYGALLDFTNPVDTKFLDDQLQALMRDYGVDGFKFDGGTLQAYSNDAVRSTAPHRGTADGSYSPMEQNIAWNEFGRRYRYHEYKDTFKGGGKAVIQRLRDRGHRWDGDGLNTIVPNSLAQGLIGHPFLCPDMIGGGEWSYNRIPGFRVDEELFIRMAEASVFFPMMQFSWAPWRVLSPEGQAAVRGCADLHAAMAEEILSVIRASAVSGEPVLRTMEYSYPHSGYERITDQFFMGEDVLVCPVLTKGARERTVVFPQGEWVAPDGTRYSEGSCTVPAPLGVPPYFRRAMAERK